MRPIQPALIAAAALACLPASAQLNPAERGGLEKALALRNLSIRDLGFEKRIYADKLRPKLIDKALSDPVGALDTLMGMQSAARAAGENPSTIVDKAWDQLGVALDPDDLRIAVPEIDLRRLPGKMREPVRQIIGAALGADALVRGAMAGLSEKERRDLVQSLPEHAAESNRVHVAGVKGPTLSRDALFALIGRVEMSRLRMASAWMHERAIPAALLLRKAVADGAVLSRRVEMTLAGRRVIIGTTGPDHYVADSNTIIIDPGGDDTYEGRAASGVTGAGLVVDCGGDDNYRLGDLSGGAGLLGVGMLIDLGGSDRFQAGSFGLGCGLCGAGVLLKLGGDDTYRALAAAEGFGQFGVGVLMDTGGDDRYDVKYMGQGCARTRGVGWLVDRAGNDGYTIGGLENGAPLCPQSWECFGQGAGFGYREDSGGVSGGIGILSELAGDDTYSGGMYSQGAAYWFGVGALMDDAGHDGYLAHYYSQAAAMHLAAAYLIDLQGNDSYAVRTGAMHAIGHDYSVAMILDRAGDDTYSGRDSRPGIGNANGAGICIDSAGDDRYMGPAGIGNPSRGSGSIGVFVDLAGKDLYTAGLSDGAVAFNGTYGVAMDVADTPAEKPTAPGQPAAPKVEAPKPGSVPYPGDSQMAAIYARASRWGVGSAQQDVAAASRQMVEIGMPAFEWMLKNRLAGANHLSLRAFETMLSALGEPAKALIPPYIGSKKGAEDDNAITLVLTHRIAAAADRVPALIQKPDTRRVGIRMAGALKAVQAVPELLKAAAEPDVLLQLAAVQSLAEIGDERGADAYARLLTHEDMRLRKAALGALAKLPARALPEAERLLKGQERDARIGVELLTAIGTDAALERVAACLASPTPGVRIEAILALKGRAPYTAKLKALEADPDPDVAAVAKWAGK